MKYKLLDDSMRSDLRTSSRYVPIPLSDIHRKKGITHIYEDIGGSAIELRLAHLYVIIAEIPVKQGGYVTIIDRVDTTEFSIEDGGILTNYLKIEDDVL